MKKSLITLFALMAGCFFANAAQAPAGDDVQTITISFTDGEKEIWPFKTPSRKLVGTTVDKTKGAYGKDLLDEMKDFVTKDGFTLKIFATNYLVEHRFLGLRYSGVGDGIDFPVIPGKSLALVTITSGCRGNSNLGGPKIVDTDNNPVEGGESIAKQRLSTGQTHSWYLPSTDAKKAYRMVQTTKTEMNLAKLELVYVTNPTKPFAINLKTNPVSSPSEGEIVMKGSFKPINADASKFKCGFEYRKSGEEFWENKNCKSADVDFSYSIKSLAKDAKYEYRAWAQAKGGSKVYGPVKIFYSGKMNLVLDFTAKGKEKSNIIYNLPSSRVGAEKFACKQQKSTFGTEYSFEFWGESGVAKATTGGAVFAFVLNPMNAEKTQFGEPFGKPGNAWVKLPGVEGRKLESVVIEFALCKADLNISSKIDKVSGTGNKDIVDNTNFKMTKSNKVKTFKTDNTSYNTPCYFCVENAANVRITKMTLVYSF